MGSQPTFRLLTVVAFSMPLDDSAMLAAQRQTPKQESAYKPSRECQRTFWAHAIWLLICSQGGAHTVAGPWKRSSNLCLQKMAAHGRNVSSYAVSTSFCGKDTRFDRRKSCQRSGVLKSAVFTTHLQHVLLYFQNNLAMAFRATLELMKSLQKTGAQLPYGLPHTVPSCSQVASRLNGLCLNNSC